jgi:teichuronic acid biosynthesis glycosyltransferase TuaG
MPIYNGIEFIDESIYSVINQTYTNWELLIGINGHPENSEVYKIAKEYEEKDIEKRIKVFDFHKIKGKSNTLNEMLQYCNYNYVALLDVDDIWFTNKLELQVTILGQYDVIGSKCVYFGDKNREGIVPNIPNGIINKSNFNIRSFNPIINSSCIIKKDLCFWNNNIFSTIEDYDLWIRLFKQDKIFYNLSEILVKHRLHSKSAFNANGNSNLVPDLLKYHKLI